ncbi:unnamed protein product, partial [Nesidiocoris tenuis]
MEGGFHHWRVQKYWHCYQEISSKSNKPKLLKGLPSTFQVKGIKLLKMNLFVTIHGKL